MIVQFKASALRQTSWYEYLVRFVLGGAMTVVAGLSRHASGRSSAVPRLSRDLPRKRDIDRKASNARSKKACQERGVARKLPHSTP